MKSAATVALLLLFSGVPLMAQEQNRRITVWVGQAEIQGENDFDSGFTTEFEEGLSYGLSANHFLNSHFSVEGSVFAIHSEAQLLLEGAPAVDLGNLSLTTGTLGVQFHFLGARRFDPYVGAGGAYTINGNFSSADLTAGGVGRIDLDNAFGYYLNVGVAVDITSGLGIVLDAREIQNEPGSRSSVTGVEEDLELSPRIYSAGLRFRF
jgi:outer membrane protein